MEFTAPLSRNEAILQNILGANNTLVEPQSRIEAILQAILYDQPYTDPAMSRIEELLLAIKNGGTWDKQSISRNEAILKAKLNGETYEEEPQSRIEELLIEWCNSTPTGILKEVSGALVTVTDALAKAAEELTVEIKPVQSGSGDPSPTNIRPISGFTGLTLTKTGVNLLDLSSLRGGAWDSAVNFPTANVCTGDYVDVKGGATYTWSQTSYPDGRYIIWYDATHTQIGDRVAIYSASAVQVTAPENARYGRFLWYKSANFTSVDDVKNMKPMLSVGATATPYTAYNGNIYNVSWQTEAGTIYGGTLDVVSGVLTVDRQRFVMDGTTRKVTYTTIASGYRLFLGLSPRRSIAGVGTASKPYLSDKFKMKYTAGAGQAYMGGGNGDQITMFFVDQTIDNLDNANDWLAENQPEFVVALATPITYQLTPTEVMMLAGSNNIWADTGDCTLEYWGTEEAQLSLGGNLGGLGLSLDPDAVSDIVPDVTDVTDSEEI